MPEPEEGDMPVRNAMDLLAAGAIVLLLVLTAIGNAVAMLAVSAVLLAVALVVSRGKLQSGSLLSLAAGAVVAVIVALVFLVIRR